MIRHINVKRTIGNSKLSKPSEDSIPSGEVEITHNDYRGDSHFENISIRPGIRMIVASHGMLQGFQMDYEIDEAPVSFCYTLSQRVRCTMESDGIGKRTVERSAGDGVLAYLPKTRGKVHISPSERVVGVSLHFCVHTFNELFNERPQCIKKCGSRFGAPMGQAFYQQSRFNGETCFVLKQIIECPYDGKIRRLFFEAKSLELVTLKLAELEQNYRRDVSEDMNRKDLDRAREAYHVLLSNLDNPPSLVDLSRTVGTNRNKLNQGFKQLYGNTVFNVLRNARLFKSWSLLKQTDLSLSEIARSVGYNNQANFSTAFRKQFGKTPKTVRREDASDPFPPGAIS